MPRDLHARFGRTGRLAHFVKFSCDGHHILGTKQRPRVHHGYTIALLSGYGCEILGRSRLWDMRADSIYRDRYSTMDNIDGKQARRTGQSSGLGELFEYVSPK